MLRAVAGPARAFIVWEPVILTDLGAPSSRALARVSDPRAAQFWDPGLTLSRAIVRDLLANPESAPPGIEIRPDTIVWDAVLVFDAGARWESRFPRPVFHAFPVVGDAEGLRNALRGLAVETEARSGGPMGARLLPSGAPRDAGGF